ncbi:MAG: hypothetical protein AUK44_06865 [Porphyromonadaceae bacterium CG2_30_38_12]|nr:MAG: hypothetical protein AUK44_06865 [Porphyromonadaceae bacterium CG2_30_38_12]
MLKINEVLYRILYAKEKRSAQREQFKKQGLPMLSLTLNIPGYPKSTDFTNRFFDIVLQDLIIFLLAHKVSLVENSAIDVLDEAGRFFIAGLQATDKQLPDIKILTESFENQFPVARVLDVDVFSSHAEPVSSGIEKKCFLCENKSAISCMRDKTHTSEELRLFIFEKIKDFLSEKQNCDIVSKLSEIAIKSILLEVSVSPKPGLVDFFSSGSHQDMNYYTFLHSVAALASFMKDFALAGCVFEGNLKVALPNIRAIGLKAERAMYKATDGVNTHKGIIFLMGISLFTSAYTLKKMGTFHELNLVENMQRICANLVENELIQSVANEPTHGQIAFEKYGMKAAGARLQAEQGFPIAFQAIVPLLKQHRFSDLSPDKTKTDNVLKLALVHIMQTIDDTNILYRKEEATANQLKTLALEVLRESKSYQELCQFCATENISPGGAADLLSISLFFYFVEKEFQYTI